MDKETLKFYERMIVDCGAVIEDADCLNHDKPESEKVDCEICRLEFIRKKSVNDFAEWLVKRSNNVIYRKLAKEFLEGQK